MEPNFRRLDAVSELMDSGPYQEPEIRGNLADLRFFNHRFGGTRLVLHEAAALLAGLPDAPRSLRVLDVAAGSADIAEEMARWGRRRGVEVEAEALDANPDVLDEARRWLQRRRRRRGRLRPGDVLPPVRLVRGDALRLPHTDRSVDLVICSNFLHHLEAPEASRALSEMRRVARRGVVAVDLARGRAAWLLVWLLTRLTTSNRLTRHDGPLSVLRAYTPAELLDLAAEAGMRKAAVRRVGPVRMALRWRAA
ncbi:MAG TPA: methyltransferase domain-containing protein [Candidatus Polarisedimenticolia bacterium]|nr:methyltransferase domain-containing protein [Candidatus Polarisedimenticolia bacterium]